MRNILYLILLSITFYSCREIETIPTTTSSYDLTGKVKFFSEKTIKIKLDDEWNYSEDTVNTYCYITNKYFNSKGVLDSIYYFDKDSLILTKVLFNFNSGNRGIISKHYDKYGKKIIESKVVSYKDSIAYIEDYNPDTKEILSKTWSKKVNCKTIWMKSENIKNKIYSEWVYERNNDGIETGIKTKFGQDNNQDYRIIKLKYLEWDIKGNWTKRIEYNEKDLEKDCMLKTRKINYYE